MKAKILLRAASILMLLHDIGHTMGHLSWNKSPDSLKQEVIKQMTDNKFLFMGTMRSMSNYYEGFSLAATLTLLMIAAILWIVSGSVAQHSALVKKILVVISLILLAWGIDELVYFFPFAAAFSLLAMLLTVIAIFNIKNAQP